MSEFESYMDEIEMRRQAEWCSECWSPACGEDGPGGIAEHVGNLLGDENGALDSYGSDWSRRFRRVWHELPLPAPDEGEDVAAETWAAVDRLLAEIPSDC